MNNTSIKRGTIWIRMGLLLIVAAFSLMCYNLWDELRVQSVRDGLLEQMLAEAGKETQEPAPDFINDPDMEMPVREIDGHLYLGILEIPSLEIIVPVMSDWSYPQLKISPCRYKGSAYRGDLIIAAHNYRCHFGTLKSMNPGETVIFTDVDGNVFQYRMTELEILDPYAAEELESGDWDLTLFTCTYGGRQRVTVRFVQSE